jgi:hypothetical protein
VFQNISFVGLGREAHTFTFARVPAVARYSVFVTVSTNPALLGDGIKLYTSGVVASGFNGSIRPVPDEAHRIVWLQYVVGAGHHQEAEYVNK